jgi:hypothetical protein
VLFGGNMPADSLIGRLLVHHAVSDIAVGTCVLLLACAVVAGRRPPTRLGPEADYRDPPAG